MKLLLNAVPGALGAFTTFSTFSYEAVTMIQDGGWYKAGWYVLAGVALGLAVVAAGFGTANLTLTAR